MKNNKCFVAVTIAAAVSATSAYANMQPASSNGQQARATATPARSATLQQAFKAIATSPDQNRTMIVGVQGRDAAAVTALLVSNGYTVARGSKIIFPASDAESQQTGRNDIVLSVASLAGTGGTPPKSVGLIKIGGVWVDWDTWNGNMWWIWY